MVTGAAGAFRGLKGLVLLPVVARYLGIGEYGAWVQALATVTLLTAPGILSLDAAVIRLLPEYAGRRERRAFASAVMLLAAPAAAVACIGLWLLAQPLGAALFRGAAHPTDMVRLSSALLFGNVLFSLGVAFLRGDLRIPRFAQVSIGRDVLSLGVAVAAVVLTGDPLLSFGAYAASWLVAGVGTLAIGLRGIGLGRPDLGAWPALARFSSPLVVSHPLGWVSKYGNNYLLGFLLGVEFVGVYGAARVIGDVMKFLSGSMSSALGPHLANLMTRNEQRFAEGMLTRSVWFFLSVSVPAVVVSGVAGDWLLSLGLGRSPGLDGQVLALLAGSAALIAGLYSLVAEAAMAHKRTELLLRIWAVIAAVQVGLSLLLVPRLGVVGAALADLGTQGALLALTLAVVARFLTLRWPWSTTALHVVALAGGFLGGRAVQGATGSLAAGIAVALLAMGLVAGAARVATRWRESGAARGAVGR